MTTGSETKLGRMRTFSIWLTGLAIVAAVIFGYAHLRARSIHEAAQFNAKFFHEQSYADHERIGETVVITAKPRFEERGQVIQLVISDTNHSFGISWGVPPDVQFIPVSLDTNRFYTFTVTQKRFYSFTIPELRKVQMDDQTIYDIEVCEIHNTTMEHKGVEIAYGLILPNPGQPSGDTERRLFPHRHERSLGGCVITPDSPKTERIYVCSGCKSAYEEWMSENTMTK